ncbi:hypothetical protein ACI8B_60118 [Acinetobacter proteolyticus]|uniref:SGNH hydrolase-type esterase domain-containing protein n=1 Tax=Acinetobacter proteolyticus TaxID=1776741 RepID=A0A653KDV3_9GAMM|nr:GDSL-type esterase/lipase family protein [Acinetobacter proteolyticus]VXA58276.1 hypothetical protein ACI8B_60118 [Acinetobacter proteolyticus]
MTVPVSDRLSQLYVGNDINTRFDFTFRVFKQEDTTGIAVRIKKTVEFETLDPSAYTVTLNQDQLGGYVTFNAAPKPNTFFYIAGATPLDQLLDITNYDNFYPDAIERALDKLTALLQEWGVSLDQEKQARILADLHYDSLAMEREENLEARLTSYINAMIGITNPAVFDGITDRMVITKDGRTQREFNESIPFWTNDYVNFKQATYLREEQILDHVAVEDNILNQKIISETTRAVNAEHQLQEQINANGIGNRAYLTYSAMVADKLNIPAKSKVTVTNDPDTTKNGDYQYDGTNFTKTGFDPYSYVDGFLKNVTTLPSGSSLNSANTFGYWLLPTGNTYTDLPPDFVRDDTVIIHVTQSTGAFFEQSLHKINEPTSKWARSCRVSDGVGVWRSPNADYRGAFDGVDPISFVSQGSYVLTNGLNMPSGFSGAALVSVKRVGGFVYRRVVQTTNVSKQWEKIDNGVWAEAMPFALTNDRFPADYNFRGLVTDANYNNLNSEGNWLLNGSPTNGPSWITGTQYAHVRVLGSFRIQEALSASTANQIAQRTGQLVSGTVNWGPWNKIGDNYKGLFTAVDIDTLNANGRYLVNGAYTNGAPFIIGTQFVDTAEYGTFRVQKATSVSSSDLIAQRTGTFGSGVVTWGPWNKFGGVGGGNSGSSLNGKTIANVGDSTTEQGDWIERLCERYGATPLKFGFGGCRMGRYESSPLGYDKQCMYNIAKCINTGDFSSVISGAEWTRDNASDDNTPQANALSAVNWASVDVLVISFGTNDWNGNPLGTSFIADPTGATFKGALCYVIEQIQSKYPHLQLVFVGMSYRLKTGATDPSQNSDDEPSAYGYLYEYQQAILEAAAKYHLPAYDFYKNSGVNRYTYTQYLRDGVHPKPISGYQHWANKIGSFLNSSV